MNYLNSQGLTASKTFSIINEDYLASAGKCKITKNIDNTYQFDAANEGQLLLLSLALSSDELSTCNVSYISFGTANNGYDINTRTRKADYTGEVGSFDDTSATTNDNVNYYPYLYKYFSFCNSDGTSATYAITQDASHNSLLNPADKRTIGNRTTYRLTKSDGTASPVYDMTSFRYAFREKTYYCRCYVSICV